MSLVNFLLPTELGLLLLLVGHHYWTGRSYYCGVCIPARSKIIYGLHILPHKVSTFEKAKP